MKNFIQDGKSLPVALSGTVVSGAVAKIGSLVGVYSQSGDNGDSVEVSFEGVYEVAKEAPLVISQGDRLYWDAGASKMTKTSAGNTFAGFAAAAALSAATVVEIKLVAGDSSASLSASAYVAPLSGTLTGTTDDTIEDVADIALSTSDTYSDAAVNSAVNAAILDVNLQLKELQVKQEEILDALVAAGLMAAS